MFGFGSAASALPPRARKARSADRRIEDKEISINTIFLSSIFLSNPRDLLNTTIVQRLLNSEHPARPFRQPSQIASGTPQSFASRASISGSCCLSSSRVNGKKPLREQAVRKLMLMCLCWQKMTRDLQSCS